MTQAEFISALYSISLRVQQAVIQDDIPRLAAELKKEGIHLEYPYFWNGRLGFRLETMSEEGTLMQMPFLL
jgi:hypothetical protein